MNRILVAYSSMAGSTAEVAQAVGEELARGGLQVDVLPIGEVKSVGGYDALVVGAPMILGWHRPARRFLRKNRKALQHIPLALFATAMSLTKTGEPIPAGVPVFVDETLPKPPATAGRLSLKERYATLANYLEPMQATTRPGKPAAIAIFGGRMEYGRLKWWAVLFAMVIIQARAGDLRNWDAIRRWAAGLQAVFMRTD